MKRKKLAHFRNTTRKTVFKLRGLKSIMRVTTPRKFQWWLVIPATGETDDAVCVLLDKRSRWECTAVAEANIAEEYASRIIAE